MPILPRKSILAITAVINAALNARDRPMPSKALSKHPRPPSRHLEPILRALTREGILKGAPGRHGGYMLAREQRQITVRDILRAIGVADDETLDPALAMVEDAFLNALSRISLEHLTRSAVTHGYSGFGDSGFDTHLASMHRNEAELLEQIRLSVETIERSQELLMQIDDLLAKSPLR